MKAYTKGYFSGLKHLKQRGVKVMDLGAWIDKADYFEWRQKYTETAYRGVGVGNWTDTDDLISTELFDFLNSTRQLFEDAKYGDLLSYFRKACPIDINDKRLLKRYEIASAVEFIASLIAKVRKST